MTGRPPTCLIACGIFRDEIRALEASGEIDVETHFLSENLHRDWAALEKALTRAIEFKSRTHRTAVLYGDVCLGFNGEMKALIERTSAVKADILNCLDCALGGSGGCWKSTRATNIFSLTKPF